MAVTRAVVTMNLRFYGVLNTIGTGSMCGTVSESGLDRHGIAWTLRLVEEGDRHAPPSSRVPMRSRYNYNISNVFVFISQ